MLTTISRRWESLIGTLFLSIFLGGTVFTQSSTIPDSMSQTGWGGNNSIIGTVFGPSGRRLESRMRIRISTMTKGDRIMTTDENGNFAFRGLPTGSYSLTIEKEKDFEPFSTNVDVRQFSGSPPQIFTLNIQLKLKKGLESKTEVVSAEFADVPQTALAYYNSAMGLAGKGDRAGAVEQLRLAIKAYPTFMLAYNELGVQYLRLNQLENADEAFQGALKINPEALSALVNRGIVNVMMQRHGEAVPILKKAKKIDEGSAVCRYFLGQALANLGLFDDAEKEFNSAISLGKEEMKEAHRFLAIIYNNRGEKKRAAAELEIYLRLAPATKDAEQLRQLIEEWKAAPGNDKNSKPSN